MSLITVIGRGHSGTRAISHTLYASGVYMGNALNRSGDKMPPQSLYEACRVMARYVKWEGGLSWDFSALHTGQIDPAFKRLIDEYLADVLNDSAEHKGWKLPETTLVFPWIVRLYPQIKYIYWIRDPRDCIIGGHKTDDLGDFGIEYPPTDDVRRRRAISWKYQYDLMAAVEQPANHLTVRFEDFVLRQEETLGRLEAYLGIPLGRIVVRPETLGRWKKDDQEHYFDFFRQAMIDNDYTEGLPPGP
jgi:hypothetical protein